MSNAFNDGFERCLHKNQINYSVIDFASNCRENIDFEEVNISTVKSTRQVNVRIYIEMLSHDFKR